jgi:GNAT superfamily N-acetyltransferase
MAINYRFITEEEFWPLFKIHRPIIFAENNTVDIDSFFSEEDKAKRKKLNEFIQLKYNVFLVAYDDNNNENLIGWSWGFAKSNHEYYMCNSAVYPEYRGKKIYTTLMNMVIEKVAADGFQEITSKHHTSNNAVLIPKLKKGFLISGTEINTRFGLMVSLTYFPNKQIEHVFHQRIGFKK